MTISAALVKELRERTGSGMMECKKALSETNGDIEAAIELMRKSGLAKADKKAGRIAAEGLIIANVSSDNKSAVMLEVNCETDFVAKGDDFREFAMQVAETAAAQGPQDLDTLLNSPLKNGTGTIAGRRQELIAKIGENISVRRYVRMATNDGIIVSYCHGTRIGVLVEMRGGDAALAKDIAMHIAASRPVCINSSEVAPDLINKEREIFAAQAAESGKPAEIIEKMVAGRISKFLKEITLLGQPFVKDPEMPVEKLLQKAGATVIRFERFAVGEGVEKKADNFVEEVMAQARGN